MSYLVISSSLNPESRSRVLAQSAFKSLQETGVATRWLDLADYTLPLCDGHSTYDDPQVVEVAGYIKEADGIIFAVPIYNFYANAAAKNLIELAGSAWSNKIVGFLCAAGGKASYMSVMSLANTLMLDFRCLIIPRFAYATGDSFDDATLSDPKVKTRILELTQEMDRLCQALKK